MGAAGWVAGQPRVAEWTDMGGQRMGDNVLGGLGTCDLGGGLASRGTRLVQHSTWAVSTWAVLVSCPENWRERTGQSQPSCDCHGGQGAQEPWKQDCCERLERTGGCSRF